MSIEAAESEPTTTEPASAESRRPLVRRSLLTLLLAVMGFAAIAATFREPLSVWRNQMRARDLLRVRKDTEALDALRTALRADLENNETLLLLARVHRRLGNLSRAVSFLDRAERLGGNAQRIERERRLALVQSGRILEGEAYLADMLINAGPDGPDICQAYVQGYFASFRIAEALKLLEIWEESHPEDAQPIFMRAYLLQNMSQPAVAVELYRKGLAAAPYRMIMRRRLAESLLEIGEIEDADKELAICIDQDPNDVTATFVLAKCAYARGDMEAATARLDKTMQRDPEHLDARRLKGQIRLAMGDADGALAELNVVVGRRPYDTLAREALGRTLSTLGRAAEAQTHFDFVSQADDKIGRLNRSLREALQNPQDADLRYEIGSILFQYGPPEDAAKWMQAAISLEPGHRAAHQALAAYYDRQGDAAKEAFHQMRAGTERSGR